MRSTATTSGLHDLPPLVPLTLIYIQLGEEATELKASLFHGLLDFLAINALSPIFIIYIKAEV